MPTPADEPTTRTQEDRPPPADGRAELYRLLSGLDLLDLLARLPGPGDTRADGDVRVGRYRLRRRLGAGGFGTVYAADDDTLSRRVVLKVPRPDILGDPDLRERFLREARSAGRLDHPGVVPVLDAGEDGGLPYLVAAFVDGPTLAQWLAARAGPPEHRVAAAVVAWVAASVQHAHERAVLHCDLKPSNILLERPGLGEEAVPGVGVPRLTDFGLARLLEEDPALTRTLLVAGTPLYMAPEQARGDRRSLTARADVYALGAILYELLTGRPPFTGAGSEVLARLLTEAPAPPRRLDRRVPRDLEAVCLRCLHRDPALRYPTAAALADDLARFAAGRPTAARPVGPLGHLTHLARRRPAASALAGALAAALAAAPAVGMWYSARLREETGVRRQAEADAGRSQQVAAAEEFAASLERVRHRRLERPPGWAGASLAELRRAARLPLAGGYSADLRTEAAAALAAVDPAPPRVLAPGFRAYAPAFRPDGALLALGEWSRAAGGQCLVKLLDPATGAEVRALSYPADADWERRRGVPVRDGCRSLAFSPDGRWLALGARSGWIVRWDLAEPDPRPVRWRHAGPAAEPADDRVDRLAFTQSGHLLVSSDGRRVAGWGASAGWANAFRAEKGRATELVRPARAGDRLLVASDDGLYAVGEDPPALQRLGDTPGRRPAAGPGGRTGVAARIDFDRYFLFDGATGRAGSLLALPGDARTDDDSITDVAFAPSGAWLATAAEHVGHLKLWDVASGSPAAARVLESGSLRMAFAPGGGSLAVCVESGTLVFDLGGLGTAGVVAAQPQPLADAFVSPSGAVATYALGLAEGGAVSVWGEAGADGDPPHRHAGLAIEHNNSRVVALADGGEAAAWSSGGGVAFRRDPLAPPRVLSGPEVRNLRDLRFGPGGLLWAACEAGLLCWTPGTDAPPRVWPAGGGHHYTRVTSAGGVVLAGRSDGVVERAGEPGGPPAARHELFGGPVTALALSADGRLAIAGSQSGGVRVIRVEAGGVVVDLPDAHRDAVRAAAFGPGGWFVTGSRDRAVTIWDAAGRRVVTLPQSRPVGRAFVSPNGCTLTLLAEGERGLRRWDLDRLRSDLGALGLDPGLP